MPQPERIQIELSAYLDGELDPKHARRVEALLAESPEARRTLESLRQARDAVASLPHRTAPPDLRSHVRRQIERLSLLERPPARPRIAVLAWRSALAVAAVLVAAVGLWWAFRVRPEAAPSGQPAVARMQPAPPVAAARPAPPPAPARPAPAVAKATGDQRPTRVRPEPPVPTPDRAAPAEPRPDAEAVRVARAPADRDTDSPAAAPASHAAGAGPVLAMPRVEVIVQPRDASQYKAARRVLSWWSRPPATHPRQPEAESASDGSGTVRAASVSGPSTPMRTRLLLERLREVAPQEVRVRLTFAPRDLDTVRAILERPEAEPLSRLLSALEAPVLSADVDMMPEITAESSEPRLIWRPEATILAMRAYKPEAREPLAREARAKDETVRLAAFRRLDAGQAALRWLQQAPEYARAAGRTVEWTARRLLDELRQELSPVRVELRLLPPPGGDIPCRSSQDHE